MRRATSSTACRCVAVRWVALVTVLWMGCGVPQSRWSFHRALLDADRLADDGHYTEAREAYAVLASEAERDDLARYVRFRLARMLEAEGRTAEALAAYQAMFTRPQSLFDHEAAKAMWRTALIHRDVFGDVYAWEAWSVRVVETFPNTIPADDALLALLRHWRASGTPATFVAFAAERYEALANTEIADNLVYWSGRVLQEDIGDTEGALALYAVIRFRFHRSGFWDDAVWRSILAYQSLHAADPSYRDEIGRSWQDIELRALANFIEAREVSWVMADYESAHYIPTLYRMAEIHEERGELAAAIATYRRFQTMYPLSLRVDDVQFQIMELQAELGDLDGMQASLVWLQETYPESKYIDDAQALIGTMEGRR